MKKFKGVHNYHNESINDDGWIVGMSEVMFGMRVVVYHRDDKINLPGNICAGADEGNLLVLYAHLYSWLDTNPKNVVEECRRLHSLEIIRPYGRTPELVEAIESLPKTD